MLLKKPLKTDNRRISLVYINVSNNPQKSSSTYIKLKINKHEIKTIVDSGAEVTLISKALAKKLKLRFTKMNDNVQYIAANNEVLLHSCFTILEILIGQWRTMQKAIVVDNLNADILLGTDWLTQYGVVINYAKALLTCGEFTTNLITTKTQTSFCINTVKSIVMSNGFRYQPFLTVLRSSQMKIQSDILT